MKGLTMKLHPKYSNARIVQGMRVFIAAAYAGLIREEYNFDMKTSCGDKLGGNTPACGTVACIGGWTGVFMGLTKSQSDEFVLAIRRDKTYMKLSNLFFPKGMQTDELSHWEDTAIESAKRAEAFLKRNGFKAVTGKKSPL